MSPSASLELLVVGINHRTAPLAMREALAVSAEELPAALASLRREAGVDEAMLLSTCNRLEVYCAGDEAALERLTRWFEARAGAAEGVSAHLYRHLGERAAQHAFRVAAGLDSLVVGEPQVLGQVKQAYEVAQAAGAVGARLNALRHRTLSVAKRIRTETGIGRHAVSVSHVAVELARKIFGGLSGCRVLLIGAGRMGALAARRLAQSGAQLVVTGRTFARAQAIASSLGGRAAAFETLDLELARADVVVSSTGAPGFVVSRGQVAAARGARRGLPLFLIDIALPRDVDPEVRGLSGVFLYDLDDLHGVAAANLRERRNEARAAEQLVLEETRAFVESCRLRDSMPLLVELRRRGDEIRKVETERARRRMGPLTAEQEKALEAVTAAIVNKLLHAPTQHLKQLARTGEDQLEEAPLLRAVLGLP